MNFSRPRKLKTPLTSINACMSSRLKPSDHYDTLKVSPNATQEEIKTAYYRLTKQYHPDMNKSEEAKGKFREVAKAYEVIGNYKARRQYDRGMVARVTPVRSPDNKEKEPDHMAFYRSRMKTYSKPVRTGDTKMYDFDAWTRAHYGDTFKRTMAKKQTNIDAEIARNRVPLNNTRDSKEFSVILGITIFLVLAIMFSETRDNFDDVVVNYRKESENESER